MAASERDDYGAPIFNYK